MNAADVRHRLGSILAAADAPYYDEEFGITTPCFGHVSDDDLEWIKDTIDELLEAVDR